MEKLATDIYSFCVLRENGFTYVDKTAMLLPLCDMSVGKQFFLARPQRFGKSLLISTLHCLFEGRRELFQGLAIEPKYDFSGKTVRKLGISFSSEKRTIVGVKQM